MTISQITITLENKNKMTDEVMGAICDIIEEIDFAGIIKQKLDESELGETVNIKVSI